MKTPEFPPMTVVELRVDAFKRIAAADVHPSPTGLVPVRGKNGAGKSSLIESMIAALVGGKGAPEMPITDGHATAEVVLDLGEIIVERKWTRDSGGKAKAKLVVKGRNGATFSSPQAVLDSLTGHFADPVAFLAMTPAEQTKTVLGVLGLDEELDTLEGVERTAVEQRRDVNRDYARVNAAVETLRADVAALPAAADVDVGALATRLREANASNAARAQKISARDQKAETGKVYAESVEKTRARIVDLRDELASAEAELAELEGAVTLAREAWTSLNADVEKIDAVDTAPIEAQLEAARAATEEQGKRTILAAEEAKLAELAAASETCEGEVDEARAAIAALLTSTTFPVEGMSYDADGKQLTVDGIPFSQASQAQRLAAAASVAMSGDPKIRVLFVREGSLLDDDMTALVAGIAAERGFQLWIEKVDSHREGPGVFVEDGSVYEAVDTPVAATATTEEN